MVLHIFALAVVVWAENVHGVALFSDRYDTQADWLSGVIAKGPTGCDVGQPRTGRPRPTCTGNVSEAEVARIKQLGHLLAPKLFFHELEWSSLADPAAWLEKATVYDPIIFDTVDIHNNSVTLDQQFKYLSIFGANFFASQLFPTTNELGANSRMSTARLKQMVTGDPIVDNYSTAKLWYTVIDASEDFTNKGRMKPGEALIFKFHFFYPFNGCSNQLLAINLDGKYQGLEYVMCAPGVHEGDWEHLSMWVCPSAWNDSNPSQAIKRVQYAAHSWNNQYDCNLGECPFITDERGDRRLAAYVGLQGHATYTTTSPLHVYEKVSAALLLNIDGIYIGDRTSDKGAVFLPHMNNTLYMPLVSEMTAEQRLGEFAWAYYSGSWGGSFVVANGVSVTCFGNNLTTQAPSCPARNPAYSYLDYFLSLQNNVVPEQDLLWYNNINSNAPYSVGALLGPLSRDYTYKWEDESQAPVWDGASSVTCPFSGDPTRTSIGDQTFRPLVWMPFVAAMIGILVGTGVLFAVALYFPRLQQGNMELSEMLLYAMQPEEEPDIRSKSSGLLSTTTAPPGPVQGTAVGTDSYYPVRHLLWMGLGLACYATGFVGIFLGMEQVIEALNLVYKLAVWELVRKAIIIVVIVFGVVQVLCIAIVVFIRSQEYLLCYFCWFKNPCGAWTGATKCGWLLQSVLAGLHVMAINACMLLFGLGFALTLARMIFQVACNEVLQLLFSLTPAAELCLDFNSINVDIGTICGGDLTKFCSRWHYLHIEYLAYGGMLLALSHIFFLNMAVHHYMTLQLLGPVRVAMGLVKSYHKQHSSRRGQPSFSLLNGEVMPGSKMAAPRHMALGSNRMLESLHEVICNMTELPQRSTASGSDAPPHKVSDQEPESQANPLFSGRKEPGSMV